jgi:hypothetical protein
VSLTGIISSGTVEELVEAALNINIKIPLGYVTIGFQDLNVSMDRVG